MERFDPDFICNASDDGGRYTYAKQPEICKWNCGKFAEAIANAVPVAETKDVIDRVFDVTFRQHYRQLMAGKLGLTDCGGEGREEKLDSLVESLFDTMKQTGADFTNTFRVLGDLPYPPYPSKTDEAYETAKAKTLDQMVAQCCTVDDLKMSLRYGLYKFTIVQNSRMSQHQSLTHALGNERKSK